MQSFAHPFELLPLALWHVADRTFSFFLILAQHCLFFLLLIGSSSKGIRRTSIDLSGITVQWTNIKKWGRGSGGKFHTNHCILFTRASSWCLCLKKCGKGLKKERPFSFLIFHETQISITNSLNRTLCLKIWASNCSAEYWPRMQKAHFRLSCVRLKTSFKLCIKMLNNISMQNVVSPLLLVTWSPKPASRARLLNL